MRYDTLIDMLHDIVAEATGVDKATLRSGMHLEGDLSLDSIKLIGLLGLILQKLPRPADGGSLEIDQQDMLGFQTLGDIGAYLGRKYGISGPQPGAGGSPDPSQASSTAHAQIGPSAVAPAPAEPSSLTILDAQYLFLLSGQLVGSNSLCSCVRVRGRFDPGLGRQAWARLVARHPMLRARFRFPEGRAAFADVRMLAPVSAEPPPLVVQDISRESPVEREASVSREFNRLLNLRWPLDQWPLHAISAFRLEEGIHVIFLAIEHVVSDGLGNQRMLHEFLELYAALAEGREPSLPAPMDEASWNRTAERMNAYGDAGEKRALDAYLAKQGRRPCFWNPERKALTHPLPVFANLQAEAPPGLLARLNGLTAAGRMPLNVFLVSAYLRTLAESDPELDSIILQVPTSGQVYPGIDVGYSVGCFAQNMALTFALPRAGESWTALARRVHHELRAGLAQGFDRAQARSMAEMIRRQIPLEDGRIAEATARLARQGVKSNLYFPFTGKTELQRRYGSLEVVQYRAGTINSPGVIDILQEIWDGRLLVNLNYDSLFHQEARMWRLVDAYLENLGRLAATPAEEFAEAPKAGARPVEVGAPLRALAEDVLKLALADADLDKDLEAGLGMDSLQRVRLIARLTGGNPGLDPLILFDCRSLREMAAILEKSAPQSPAPSPSAAPAVSAAGPQDQVDLGEDDVPIPFLHFVRMAETEPGLLAVDDAQGTLTYGELHARSNQLAAHLRAAGVGRGDAVCIVSDRGTRMMTGIFAILKAGAAYVPIDPAYPEGRMQYILSHSRASVLLLMHAHASVAGIFAAGKSPENPGRVILLDGGEFPGDPPAGIRVTREADWRRGPEAFDAAGVRPEDRMVVLYTSGSTGNPKGVALNHLGYYNRIRWHHRAFGLRRGEGVAQKTSCCFDVSVWELFWPLMVGGTLYAAGKSVAQNPWALADWMVKKSIAVIHFVPPMFAEFVNAILPQDRDFPALRWLIFSGEVLPVPLVGRWMDKYGNRFGLANLYGPTEASIDVTCHLITEHPGQALESFPIGKAIDGVQLLVVDPQRRRLPPGETGELCIAGIQLAEGYLFDPERTAKAFIPNVYEGIGGARIYLTGDLATELPDGSYGYHGRIDNQVKVRGYRIELGEVESALLTLPEVKEACVLAVDDGDSKRLVAWLSGTPGDADRIKREIGRRLAEYMVPHRFIWMDELPKNGNGKMDRKALLATLAAPAHPKPPATARPAAPVNTPVTAPANAPVNAPVTAPANAPVTVPGARTVLGPGQKWLMQHFGAPYRWVGYTRFRFHQPLNLRAFRQAINGMIREHEILRVVFEPWAGEWRQVPVAPPEYSPLLFDAEGMRPEDLDREVHRALREAALGLELGIWPLFQILVVRVDEKRHDITIVGHHMVADLISGEILFAELWKEYFRLLSGTAKPAPVRAPSYLELARYLEAERLRGNLDSHVERYRTVFSHPDARLRLPADFAKGPNTEDSGASIARELTGPQTASLMRNSRKSHGSTLYALLAASLYRFLAKVTGQSFITVSHRMNGRDLGAGRPRFFGSLGNFAVNFPVGVAMPGSDSWPDLISRVSDALDAVPMGGTTYDFLAEALPFGIYPDSKLTPIRLNYLGILPETSPEVFEHVPADRGQRLAMPGQPRTALIEVVAVVENGRLGFRIEYSRNFHAEETVARWADAYVAELRELAAGIAARPEPEPAQPVAAA